MKYSIYLFVYDVYKTIFICVTRIPCSSAIERTSEESDANVVGSFVDILNISFTEMELGIYIFVVMFYLLILR